MTFYIDLDSNAVIEAPGNRTPLNTISHKLGDGVPLRVQWVRAGTPERRPEGATIKYGLKLRGKYDGTFIVSATSFTRPAEEDGFYTGSLRLNTTAAAELLKSGDADDENDRPSISLMGEFAWKDDPAGLPTSTDDFVVVLKNDVIKDTEGDPAESDPTYPDPDAIALKAPANGGYLISEAGLLKLWNATQGIYQTVSLTGAVGAETLVIHAS